MKNYLIMLFTLSVAIASAAFTPLLCFVVCKQAAAFRLSRETSFFSFGTTLPEHLSYSYVAKLEKCRSVVASVHDEGLHVAGLNLLTSQKIAIVIFFACALLVLGIGIGRIRGFGKNIIRRWRDADTSMNLMNRRLHCVRFVVYQVTAHVAISAIAMLFSGDVYTDTYVLAVWFSVVATFLFWFRWVVNDNVAMARRLLGEPYYWCKNCTYSLVGLVDRSCCPECGMIRKLIDVVPSRVQIISGKRTQMLTFLGACGLICTCFLIGFGGFVGSFAFDAKVRDFLNKAHNDFSFDSVYKSSRKPTAVVCVPNERAVVLQLSSGRRIGFLFVENSNEKKRMNSASDIIVLFQDIDYSDVLTKDSKRVWYAQRVPDADGMGFAWVGNSAWIFTFGESSLQNIGFIQAHCFTSIAVVSIVNMDLSRAVDFQVLKNAVDVDRAVEWPGGVAKPLRIVDSAILKALESQ